MSLRPLTSDETGLLELQGCRCTCWDKVKVEDPFIVSAYRNVTFAGDIALYPAEGNVSLDNATFESGISNAFLSDCSVGRGVHIANIGNVMSGCTVGDRSVIRNVDTIDCPPSSNHGTGVEVEVLSETGGREVPIYYGLSAQEAWAIAMCRHDMTIVDRLKSGIREKSDASQCGRTIIGTDVTITGSGHLSGLDIRSGATIRGASRLVNGTVGEDAYVGTDVIAADFIMARKSTVDTAARIDHVFVGEGSRIANGFSAHHSLIFSNCILENGEAAALFAGPYTVSMHKSTLLIGGMMSMFNAGSGANQSNHLYKTGPCHHGVLERGVKLASDAYLMWPAHIGAFSMVMGRHKSHPDTSSLPFSYVVENEGATMVIPALALGNIGVARDADKWPRRDRRPQPSSDIITFDILNPYTAQRISEGIALLENLTAGHPGNDTYACRGFIIKKTHAQRALTIYRSALRHYMLGTLMRRIADGLPLTAGDSDSCQRWIDIAGMAAPADMLRSGLPDSRQWDATYRRLEWNRIARQLADEPGLTLPDPDKETLARLLDEWLQIDRRFADMLRHDAEKEFDSNNPDITAGFGQAGENTRAADFQAVRGSLDAHPVAALLKARTDATAVIADAVRKKLQ